MLQMNVLAFASWVMIEDMSELNTKIHVGREGKALPLSLVEMNQECTYRPDKSTLWSQARKTGIRPARRLGREPTGANALNRGLLA